LASGHPITTDKGTVRQWITKEWSEQRKIFKSSSNESSEAQDPLEQATSIFQSIAQSVSALQSTCDANSESYLACHRQLEKSDENLQRISTMIATLESMLQAPQSPETKTG
jgi:chromosome segregation ATPase